MRVNLLTPGSWPGASDTDSCSLKNLVLGETFEGFEARHIAVLERFTLAVAREMESGGGSTDLAEGSCCPIHRRGAGEVNQFKGCVGKRTAFTVFTARTS